MPRSNIVFVVVTPLLLLAIVAALIIGIGTTLLQVHEIGREAAHVERYTGAAKEHAEEAAAMYPVAAALLLSVVILVGSVVASRIAPPPKGH